MARTRNIKPGFFKDEELVDLGFPAMILFAGLWTLADRDGRLEDRPRMIKAEVFPYTNTNVEKLLCSLDEHRFIVRYEVNGQKYIQVRTWKKHQNPNIKECASVIPAPVEHGAGMVPAPNGHISDTASIPLYLKPLTSIPLTDTQIDHDAEIELGELIQAIATAMRARHAKTAGLGGLNLERKLTEIASKAVDPYATLRSIDRRHQEAVEREWRGLEVRYVPRLLQWLEEERYLDPIVTESPPDRLELARRALE